MIAWNGSHWCIASRLSEADVQLFFQRLNYAGNSVWRFPPLLAHERQISWFHRRAAVKRTVRRNENQAVTMYRYKSYLQDRDKHYTDVSLWRLLILVYWCRDNVREELWYYLYIFRLVKHLRWYVLFLVKGNKREASMWLKVYKSIPSSRVAGFEVRTTTGFCSINETGVSSS